MRIGLVAEVKWEVREVCRQLEMNLVDPDDQIWGAALNGHQVRLCLSGMVPTIAKERVTRFLDTHAPEIMISCGLAGALCPKVLVGDLIVQSRDPSLSAHAEEVLRRQGISFHVGPLVTVSKPVLTPEARREVSASSQAIGVDMESQTIAELCRQRGIRCMAIKGVSDGIDDDLSPILGGFEIIHIPKIAGHVLFSPSTWGLAMRVARQSYSAATNLGHGVWATLQGLH
jgi:nucleoside phosphorylase